MLPNGCEARKKLKMGIKMKCRNCNKKLGTRNHTARKNSTTNLCFSCIRNPPLEDRCVGITAKGHRCKVIKYRNTEYCKIHLNQKNKIQITKGEIKNENKIYNTNSR
jgi:hypothetical protein